MGVCLTVCGADQLPGHQRRQGREGIQQPPVQGHILRQGGKQFQKFLPCDLQRRALFLPGRQMIEQARQHLPLLGHLEVHPPQAVGDPALVIHQDEIGVPGHGLQDQTPLALLPQLVGGLDGQGHHPLQGLLDNGQNAPSCQMLAQQHTEHRRLGGIVPQLLRQVQPGLGGSGAQQQPPPAPQQQHHLVPGGLLDLFNAGVFRLGGGLPDHGAQANGVQRHITPPPSSGRTAR